jgi:hypothetical protein
MLIVEESRVTRAEYSSMVYIVGTGDRGFNYRLTQSVVGDRTSYQEPVQVKWKIRMHSEPYLILIPVQPSRTRNPL